MVSYYPQNKVRARSLFYLRMVINMFVCFQEARCKKVPTGDGYNAIGVNRQQSKNGRKKRTKSKGPVAKQIRKRTTTTSRRNSERSLPIKSTRTVSKDGRRRATCAASGATDCVNDKEAEKSDTEVDDDDNTDQESSSDGAEDSLTLADVKKDLDEKGKHAGTFLGSDAAVTANVALAKNKGGRKTTTKKEQSPSVDATTVDSDISCGDTHVIKTNIDNSDEEKKAPDTTCTELVDESVTSVTADNDEKPPNVPSVKLSTENPETDTGAVRCEATISDESTSLIGDGVISPILETESEKGTPDVNSTENKTPPPSVDVSCHEDDVTASNEKLSPQHEANNADKRMAIGCCAPEEPTIGAAAAVPENNKTTEETEPVNGETAVAPLASMPTPDVAGSAIDREDECANYDANIPREECSNSAAPAKDQTQTNDVAEVASSENRVEILR